MHSRVGWCLLSDWGSVEGSVLRDFEGVLREQGIMLGCPQRTAWSPQVSGGAGVRATCEENEVVHIQEFGVSNLEFFRYHEDGSKKLNACNQFFLRMVYFYPEHKIWFFTDRILQLPAFLLPWRTSFLACDANTHPLLSLVCYQLSALCCFSHPNTPHRSSYNIYIDNINNISRPRPTQECP